VIDIFGGAGRRLLGVKKVEHGGAGVTNIDFVDDLALCYREEQRDRFKRGELGRHWAERYPRLFDEDDRRLYESQCVQGYHFFEWLAAVLLYESTGYLSLVEKYGSANHRRKLALWEKIVPAAVRDIDCDNGWPDLLVFAPDHEDWFFCETKGDDALSEGQLKCFRAIRDTSGRKVRLIRFVRHI
jgi:hypothetical protein